MRSYFRLMILVLAIGTAFPSSALAEGSAVDFYGTVLEINMGSSTEGTISVRLMGHPVTVHLTGDTEIEAHGDDVGLGDLSVDDFVKVSGAFSNSTIVAKEIEIVDRGEGEFRLRGRITAVRTSADGTVITVLGVDVLVNSETKIERRGPAGGFTAANLAAGMFVDARGHSVEEEFVARRVTVGMREDEAIRVDFGGRITAVETNKLMIDTEGGRTAVVLITEQTTVVGRPEVGKFAEVRGTLNSSLEVVAGRIIVKRDRNSDVYPTGRASIEFKREIALTPATDGSAMRGEAGISIEVTREQITHNFELTVVRAQPNATYRVRVELTSGDTVDFGTFTTNGEGSAEVKYQNLDTVLPTGKTVRHFRSVQVLSESTVMLQGRF